MALDELLALLLALELVVEEDELLLELAAPAALVEPFEPEPPPQPASIDTPKKPVERPSRDSISRRLRAPPIKAVTVPCG